VEAVREDVPRPQRAEHLLHRDARAVVVDLRRVRSHCRFRNRGTEYVTESGMKWMSGGAKRQCGRVLRWTMSGSLAPSAAASARLKASRSFAPSHAP
jgi:hypothetical protein